METIVETANAKINLALDVVGKRPDGYHNLEMVMTSVGLSDRLTFKRLLDDRIELSCDNPNVPIDEKNFVYQAIRLMKDQFQIKEGISVHIEKRIPMGAGLAGGSSNAAAAIRTMNHLFKLNLSLDQMYRIAERIGSDVPFCIYGKTAYVTGRGEKIVPLPSLPNTWVLLITPNLFVSTGEIFSHVDLNTIVHPSVQRVKEAIIDHDYDKMVAHLGNALEDVTFDIYPEVQRLKEKIQSFNPDGVLMSGSGPTIFALTKDLRLARTITSSIDSTTHNVALVNVIA